MSQHSQAIDPQALVAKWTSDAALLRAHGALEAATTKEHCAAELAEFAKWYELEELDLSRAAQVSGLSYHRLSHMISEGKLKNVAKPGRHPRIRRCDLPRKVQTRANPPAALGLADRVLRGKRAS